MPTVTEVELHEMEKSQSVDDLKRLIIAYRADVLERPSGAKPPEAPATGAAKSPPEPSKAKSSTSTRPSTSPGKTSAKKK